MASNKIKIVRERLPNQCRNLDAIRCPGCKILVALNSYSEHAYFCDALGDVRLNRSCKDAYLKRRVIIDFT